MLFGSNVGCVGLNQARLVTELQILTSTIFYFNTDPSGNSPFHLRPHFLHIQFSASGVAQHFPVWLKCVSTQKLAFHHLGWDPGFFPQKTWKMPLLQEMKNLIKSFFLENHFHCLQKDALHKHTLNLTNFVGLFQNLIFSQKEQGNHDMKKEKTKKNVHIERWRMPLNQSGRRTLKANNLMGFLQNPHFSSQGIERNLNIDKEYHWIRRQQRKWCLWLDVGRQWH